VAGERVLVGWPAAVAPLRRTTDLDLLTDREREVLELITDGVPTAVMAQRLGVSVNTVRTHVRSVLHKLGVHQRAKAARAAVELGLLTAV
jgi:DNA-binding NarL/FixJ family response regulator